MKRRTPSPESDQAGNWESAQACRDAKGQKRKVHSFPLGHWDRGQFEELSRDGDKKMTVLKVVKQAGRRFKIIVNLTYSRARENKDGF